MSAHPYIEQELQRRLPPDYEGFIYVWDIDKTYLQTSFSSLRGLLRIPLEFALDKRAVPGAIPLLRALRRGPGKQNELVPTYFVSGSPPQLRGVVERKMTLDGVQSDGITFKDQWGLVRAGRPGAIKEQVGYKLCALLMMRAQMPARAKWILFGDDVESDAEVFALFGEVVGGMDEAALKRALARAGSHQVDIDCALGLREALKKEPGPPTDPVEGIFIHLTGKKRPSDFAANVSACRSYLQAALLLAQQGRVSAEVPATVLLDLRRHHVPEAELAAQLNDAQARLGVGSEWVHPLRS